MWHALAGNHKIIESQNVLGWKTALKLWCPIADLSTPPWHQVPHSVIFCSLTLHCKIHRTVWLGFIAHSCFDFCFCFVFVFLFFHWLSRHWYCLFKDMLNLALWPGLLWIFEAKSLIQRLILMYGRNNSAEVALCHPVIFFLPMGHLNPRGCLTDVSYFLCV